MLIPLSDSPVLRFSVSSAFFFFSMFLIDFVFISNKISDRLEIIENMNLKAIAVEPGIHK